MSDLREAVRRQVADWRAEADVNEKYLQHANAPEIHEVAAEVRMGRVKAQTIEDLLGAHPAEVDPETGFARPLLDREALDQAIRAVVLESAKNEVKARVEGVDAVMKLARPMPTRDALMEAMRTAPLPTRCHCERVETTEHREHLADAILFLLNGTVQTTKE